MTDYKPNITKSIDNLNDLEKKSNDLETKTSDLEDRVEELEQSGGGGGGSQELINKMSMVDLTGITPVKDELYTNSYTFYKPITNEALLSYFLNSLVEETEETFTWFPALYFIKLNGNLCQVYFDNHQIYDDNGILKYALNGFCENIQYDNHQLSNCILNVYYDNTDIPMVKIIFSYNE